MRLPKSGRAIIEPAKVRDYLLSHEHPVGRFKATFFGVLGYRREQWQRLARDLVHVGRFGTARPAEKIEFGQKYEVRGMLDGPSGRMAGVVTIWIVLNGEDFPRFITAFPGEAR